jgi:hypothetical protein
MRGAHLAEKEKILLDVVSAESTGIESMLAFLGLDELESLPDDIAVLKVSDAESCSDEEDSEA